jgi:hypothetical protein
MQITSLEQILDELGGCLKVPFYIHSIRRMREDINTRHQYLIQMFYKLQPEFANQDTERLQKSA